MAYQAIETKYLGPTNNRGARVKASAQAGSVTVSWDHALNIDENHARAAQALAEKLGWSGDWHEGGAASGRGNVYVLARNDAAAFHVAEGNADA